MTTRRKFQLPLGLRPAFFLPLVGLFVLIFWFGQLVASGPLGAKVLPPIRNTIPVQLGNILAELPVTRGLALVLNDGTSHQIEIAFIGQAKFDEDAYRKVDAALRNQARLKVEAFGYTIYGSCLGPAELSAICVPGPWKDGPKPSFDFLEITAIPVSAPLGNRPPSASTVDRSEGELIWIKGGSAYFRLGPTAGEGEVSCSGPIGKARTCNAWIRLADDLGLRIGMTMPLTIDTARAKAIIAASRQFLNGLRSSTGAFP